ncbi:glycosyltransferase [Pseudoalteromonas holothuriae]|nr:glycosyltransferase [Pseudoalteromonas sp. CIP111854]
MNQITTLIDLGIDVEILALYSGDQTILLQPQLLGYQLNQRVQYLLTAKQSKFSLISQRLNQVVKGLLFSKSRQKVFAGLNPKFNEQARNLMLSSIAASQTNSLKFDWIIAHFGSSGVIVNHLRDMGVIDGSIATVFHGLDITAELNMKNTQRNYQRLFKNTELLLPISNLWRDKLLSLGADKEKIHVQRMGVDLSLFNADRKEISNKPFNILTVARFSQKKGLKYALQALASLPDSIEFKYHLVGYGELEMQLRAQCTELGLDNKVSFLGPMNSKEVVEQMRWASVFLQPSITADNGDKEGVPVSIMEAMASGTVVLSTLHSGIPELVQHKVNGLLAPEKDVMALSRYLELLCNDTVLRQDLADNALERVRNLADVKVLNQQLLSLMQQYKGGH